MVGLPGRGKTFLCNKVRRWAHGCAVHAVLCCAVLGINVPDILKHTAILLMQIHPRSSNAT
jgi:hypothetical protein